MGEYTTTRTQTTPLSYDDYGCAFYGIFITDPSC
jgi:hypothetical protein